MEINFYTLALQNPWWSLDWRGQKKKASSGLSYDPVIYEYETSGIKWRPSLLAEFDYSRDRIYFLHGQPGVGKTTAIKLTIKDLITAKQIEPDNIFYYNCGNFYTFEQLNQAIKAYLSWRRPLSPKDRLYLFIDEIKFIKDWDKGLKALRQAGRLKSITLVIVGSILDRKLILDKIFIKKELAALDFVEFLKSINPALAKINPEKYTALIGKLDYYLDIYFLTGGYPGAINSYKSQGAVSQAIYDNYLTGLMYDLARLGRDIILLKQILEQLIINFGQPIGYQTIANKTKAKTHLTIAEYLRILESMSFIKAVYQLADGQQPTSRKAKKFYFYDQFIFSLIYSFAHGSLDYWQFSREHLWQDIFHGQLVESVILSQLNRLTLSGANVFYWRDNIRKWQIDYIIRTDKNLMPILIRFNKPIGIEEEKIFAAAGFKQGIIISRNQLNLQANYKIMPLTYFLLFYRP